MSKVYVEFNKRRKAPYRVKYEDYSVYLSTKSEAKRVKKYTEKVIALLGGM